MSYAYRGKFKQSAAYCVDLIGSALFVFSRKRKSVEGVPERILVLKFDHLGDCFLATPLFEKIHKKFPTAVIDVACQESAVAVFKNNPFVHEIIAFNYPRMWRGGGTKASVGDTIRFLWKTRKNKYDACIDLRGEPFAALVGWVSGARTRVGFFGEEVGGFLYTHRLSYDRTKHETERYRAITDAFGGSFDPWLPKIYLTDAEQDSVAKIRHERHLEGSFVALHISAGLPYKIWPMENFSRSVKQIAKKFHGSFVILGGRADRHFADKFLTAANGVPVVDLVGKLDLRETYGLLAHAALFIGNDSVLAHFSGALDVPVVELMSGLVDSVRWGARGRRVEILSGFDPAHACGYGACQYPCPHMRALPVEKVVSVAARVLSSEK